MILENNLENLSEEELNRRLRNLSISGRQNGKYGQEYQKALRNKRELNNISSAQSSTFLNPTSLQDEKLKRNKKQKKSKRRIDKNLANLKIKIPKEIQTLVQQYLLFFKEYIKTTKGKDISFEVIRVKKGLEIVSNYSEIYKNRNLEEGLLEYVEYTRCSINNLKVKIENPSLREEEYQCFLLNLKLQIKQFHERLELSNYLILENQLNFQKQLLTSFSQKKNTIKMKLINPSFNGQNIIAENVGKVVYKESLGLNLDEFSILKEGVTSIEERKRKDLEQMLLKVENASNSEEKEQLLLQIKEFLLECGIAINQNIAAATIFESIKHLFGL